MEATKTLYVEGMTCKNCVKHVEEALQAVEGVQSVSVSLEQKQATVSFVPEVVDVAMLEEAVRRAGYEVVE